MELKKFSPSAVSSLGAPPGEPGWENYELRNKRTATERSF